MLTSLLIKFFQVVSINKCRACLNCLSADIMFVYRGRWATWRRMARSHSPKKAQGVYSIRCILNVIFFCVCRADPLYLVGAQREAIKPERKNSATRKRGGSSKW